MKTESTIKTDKNLKKRAEKTASELGLPLEVIVNVLLAEFVRTKELHLSMIPRMTPALEKLIGRAEKDFKAGKNISPAFSSAKEMDRWLVSQ